MHKLDQFLEIRSRWLTLIGEHLQDTDGNTLEYWRVEKADSAIILPIHQARLILPPPMYRPGIGTATWDFPGGRMPTGTTDRATVATQILQRELGVTPAAVTQLLPLNPTGWPVNSAFSNQCLYGFVAHLEGAIAPQGIGRTYPTTPLGIQELLKDLTCLQCRAVLLQWWLHNQSD